MKMLQQTIEKLETMRGNKKTLCKHIGILVVAIAGLGSFLSSCVKDDPVVISTATKEMMGEYLVNRKGEYSEFSRLLDTTEVLGLVNAYQKYTLFAPNDSAMHAYYRACGRTSLSQFPIDTLKKIAYDHLIKGYVLTADLFTDGLMPYLTMSDRYIETSSSTSTGSYIYFVNQTSEILKKNILVSNGVIHEINKVIVPSTKTLDQAIAADSKFKLFNEALVQTGLVKQIQAIRDESYDPEKYTYLDVNYHQGSGSKDEIPSSRKYGYTAFMESDSTFVNVYNIHNLEELKAYAAAHVYNEVASDANVTDITDSRNSLNKFIAYHLVNKKLPYVKLIDMYDTDHMIKTYDMYEYIETMNPNTLMEVKKERASGGANYLNKSPETGESVQIVSTYKDKDAVNGVYHEINKILIYDKRVAGEMSSKRLRMDAAAFFPEFTNNNMRIYDRETPRSWVYPPGYIKRLTYSEGTYFSYSNAYGGYQDFQGDEIFLKGLYDFELETPAIPAGTYEVRFGYQPTGARGAAQLYWDGVPCGIPLDLRILANDPLVGWVLPGSDPDDPNGYENDKMMRNRGYMKGPCTYKDAIDRWYGLKVARFSTASLRRILGTYTFKKSGPHKFTVKAVREGQFMLDYLEFVPVEVIENEDIQ
jgi:Secreted and surface protein containing fasciclin-like repeats